MKFVTLAAVLVASTLILLTTSSSGQAEVRSVKSVADKVVRSPGKLSAPVTMKYSLDSKPAIGASLGLELIFATPGNAPVNVEINADEVLGAQLFSAQRIQPGEVFQLRLVPQQEGRHYLNVTARLGSGAQSLARVFVIPVQVGTGTVVSSARKASMTRDGERLIRMQAIEPPVEQAR